VLVGVWFWS